MVALPSVKGLLPGLQPDVVQIKYGDVFGQNSTTVSPPFLLFVHDFSLRQPSDNRRISAAFDREGGKGGRI